MAFPSWSGREGKGEGEGQGQGEGEGQGEGQGQGDGETRKGASLRCLYKALILSD